ncbi:MAG: gamma carbonic anhydrase family protein [Candidatus Baldrarchaeia archaeon]
MPLIPFNGRRPRVDATAYVSDRAVLIGDVMVGEYSNIWEYAVLRADFDRIEIGRYVSVQDNVTLHAATGHPTVVGDYVVIGHNAVVHACKVGNYVLIGMGARVCTGAIIEDNVIIGAGAVVPEGMRVPSNSLVVGIPARVVRELKESDIRRIEIGAKMYAELGQKYKRLLTRESF